MGSLVGLVATLVAPAAIAAVLPAYEPAFEREPSPSEDNLTSHQAHRSRFADADRNPGGRQIDEDGDLLIIAFDPWIPNVEPLAVHKSSVGINTTIVGVSAIGSDPETIRSYIQSVYETSDLAFVLLVGDVDHVPTFYAMDGPSDPSYAKVAGGDDYPDILVGRFSASTAAHVDTQVLRTIDYEANCATEQEWFWRGAGIGSDPAALDAVRDALLTHGYTDVDRLYDPDVTPAMIAAALNDGRGIINYIGHASSALWMTGPFSVDDVHTLANDNTLPFIFSSASANGRFDMDECLAEAWLRAQHGSAPTGAIAAFMASGNLYYMEAQTAHEEFIDLYVGGTYRTFGGLCFGATSRLMDEYGDSGVRIFDIWTLFGDPSLCVVGTVPQPTSSDFDDDGDVDLYDACVFQSCFGNSPVPCNCATFDFDHNQAIELSDYAEFYGGLTGPQP
jgi:gingipain R